MHNLLPERAQKEILREYRLHFLSLLSVFFSVIFIMGIVFLLPAYILVFGERTELNQELEIIKNSKEATANKSFSLSARAVEEKIEALKLFEKKGEEPHILFEKIIEEKGKSISLQHFTYEIVGTTTTVTIDGVAKTRDDLLAFQNRLEKKSPFTEADFPVELLAKNLNIRFSMTIR